MYHTEAEVFLQTNDLKPLRLGLWAILLACSASHLAAQASESQIHLNQLQLNQTSYELRIGEPVPLSGSSDTIDFLSKAATRTVQLNGAATKDLVVGTDRAGRMVLAASPLAKAGKYNVNVDAASSTGEHRQVALAVKVDPLPAVPSGSTRNPVVLLNGWEIGFTNTCPISASSSDTFGNLAQYLNSDGVPDVYLFDNCLIDSNQPIEQLGNDLGAFLRSIQYDNGKQVPQIDLVAFSLGGVVARAYLAGLQPDGSLTPPASTLVGKMVLIATPNFGSFLAGNYANVFIIGSQSGELVPGSSLLWSLANWNQRADDLRGINAIAVIGNAGQYLPSITSTTAFNNASDGVVSLASASLGFVTQQASMTRIVPYCHVDPSAFISTTLGRDLCNAPGIANVTDTSHATGKIVRSFLGGTSDWSSIGGTPATDPYLSKDGGMFFALMNEPGVFASDLSQVEWGTIGLNNGGDISTIFYGDFLAGSGVLQASSASLGNIDCGSYAQATGYFSAVRCKLDATILSIGPLLTTFPKVVTSGGTITIAGADFGSQCPSCRVTAVAAGSTTSQSLQISSWNSTAITATLPSSLTGLVTITVYAATGTDSLAIMAATSSTIGPALTLSASGLKFTYAYGGATPAVQQVSITNSGGGALAWTASDSDYWVGLSPASGSGAGTLSVSINAANLAAGTYTSTIQVTATGATGSPATITVTLVVTGTQPAPAITSVENAAGYQVGTASATWLSIFGSNLSSTTYAWQQSDFVNGKLPTSIEGVSVTIDGIPAFIEYISPKQINLLAPDDSTTGPVQVQVTVAKQASNSFTVPKSQFLPAFFTFDNGAYVLAQHSDYTLVGSANLLSAVATRPAQAGEIISLYATGLGPTNPATPTGQLVTAAAPLANSVHVTIGGVDAFVNFAGIVESGLYQVNVTVPNLPSGDAPVLATIQGMSTQSGVSITLGP